MMEDHGEIWFQQDDGRWNQILVRYSGNLMDVMMETMSVIPVGDRIAHMTGMLEKLSKFQACSHVDREYTGVKENSPFQQKIVLFAKSGANLVATGCFGSSLPLFEGPTEGRLHEGTFFNGCSVVYKSGESTIMFKIHTLDKTFLTCIVHLEDSPIP